MVVFNAAKCNFPIHKPYNELSVEQQKMLWDGTPYFEGINSFFKFVETQQYKVQYRVMLARYRGRTTCPECKGARLRKEAQWIKVGGKSIVELITMPISELKIFFDNLVLSENDALIAKRLLLEIKNRIRFISEVGLGYLRLDRPSNTLSGGESQRINLATSPGGSLVGSLYVLDEPSIGLHSRDTGLLIKVLKELRDAGNTVVVVEHDEDIIRAADYVIDIGPNAGRLGGEVVFQGSYEKLLKEQNLENSHTYNYLLGKEKIQIPSFRKKTTNFIEVVDAHLHNLKHINVKFPLNTMTVVTGVSGSGKSSLVKNVLYEALQRYFSSSENVNLNELKGSLHLLKNVELVDQNPIGKTSRSNPATYLKAYDEIRRLFAEQPLAKQMRFTAAYFSFNVDGGRCEACQGEGTISVEMQFMADVKMECEVCHGKRFKADVLEVLYKEKNIYDVLEMTVNQAIEFFSEEKSIIKRLKPLQDVGLGYIKLGQSSSSLSGGENQRVKLAAFLANERQDPTLFIFDEPTVGLHFHDISVLLSSLNALVKRGHTLVIVEHNMDVIKCADYIIDMGKEGGAEGGNLVFAGTPEDLLECKESYTAQFLKEKLKN
jgi:excinuclease ABC subunit A